jgi:Ca2+-binding RTX toxin-like protein
MRTSWLPLAVAAGLALSPAAMAATVSGRVVDSRLLVTLQAGPGEENNIGMGKARGWAILNDYGAPLAPGPLCRVHGRQPDWVQCGPAGRNELELVARLGDGDDAAEVGAGTVFLGPGDDVGSGDLLYGGRGNDRLIGFEEPSVLFGGGGRDRISSGGRRDRVRGGPGADRIDGGREGDWIVAGPGDDAVTAGEGRDRVAGGTGDDVISVADGERDVAYCGPGRDQAGVDELDVPRGCELITFGARD